MYIIGFVYVVYFLIIVAVYTICKWIAPELNNLQVLFISLIVGLIIVFISTLIILNIDVALGVLIVISVLLPLLLFIYLQCQKPHSYIKNYYHCKKGGLRLKKKIITNTH